MAPELTLFPRDYRLVWSCARIYVLSVKILLPGRTLKKVADEVAGLCEKYREDCNKKNAVAKVTKYMDTATSLEVYQEGATELDRLQGHDVWKQEKASIETSYNPVVIQAHMEQLQEAAASSDLSALQHLLRTRLSRDLGGMNMLRLYKHSWNGTKYLIDDYIYTAVESIEKFVAAAERFNISSAEVKFYQQSLEDALKYFGRSALTLSGGAILGMKHIGVVKTLWQADLLPKIISGASAGSIVAAVVCICTDEEMENALSHFPDSNLAVFDPEGTTNIGWLMQRVGTLLKSGTFFDMKNLEMVMKDWLDDMTFREAYNKTGRILNICVSSADSAEPRLLNYITAPDVYIWSAVCASCSVPLVFPPAIIYEKDPMTGTASIWMRNAQQQFVDGSLDHDIPMRKLSEMFNVNFFIVSQVNPHVRSFLGSEESFNGKQPKRSTWSESVWESAKGFCREEIIHRAQQAADLGLPPVLWRWASLLNQQYTGDINILPEIQWSEYTHMMMNPTPKFMMEASLAGERATWPRMCRIKNCVAIELALVDAIHSLRSMANFSQEARAAREERRSTSRGPSRRGRSARPAFLRWRSMSTGKHEEPDFKALLATEQSRSGSLKVRRNVSLGSISMRGSGLIGGVKTPHLSPQAGFDNDNPAESLIMTTRLGPRTE